MVASHAHVAHLVRMSGTQKLVPPQEKPEIITMSLHVTPLSNTATKEARMCLSCAEYPTSPRIRTHVAKNVGGDCSASRPQHNTPCRVAVDGHIEGYNNAGREAWRQLWVKQGAEEHG